MTPHTYVFFGIAGSGKGTQVKLLTDLIASRTGKEVVYLYPGAEFRHLIESSTYTGNIIKDSMAKGELQPDFLTTSIVVHLLQSHLNNEKDIIADGYPRSLAQSEAFEAIMKFYGRTDVKMIYIKLSPEEAMERNLKRGRSDDTAEGIAERFRVYEANVIPAMNYFKDRPGYEIISVNGNQSIEDVHKEIISKLGLA